MKRTHSMWFKFPHPPALPHNSLISLFDSSGTTPPTANSLSGIFPSHRPLLPPSRPPLSNESDSTEVTFSNIQPLDTAQPITFTYDGNVVTNPAPVFKYDPAAGTVKILITTAMTAKPGHKELLLNGFTLAPGTATPAAVQIE